MNNNPLQPNPGSLPQPVSEETLPAMPQAQVSQSAQPSQPPATQSTPQRPIAEDMDDLGPEWLQMVDSLMRQNVQDPRVLSQELNKLKAQYISGRYGKEIKQPSEKG